MVFAAVSAMTAYPGWLPVVLIQGWCVCCRSGRSAAWSGRRGGSSRQPTRRCTSTRPRRRSAPCGSSPATTSTSPARPLSPMVWSLLLPCITALHPDHDATIADIMGRDDYSDWPHVARKSIYRQQTIPRSFWCLTVVRVGVSSTTRTNKSVMSFYFLRWSIWGQAVHMAGVQRMLAARISSPGSSQSCMAWRTSSESVAADFSWGGHWSSAAMKAPLQCSDQQSQSERDQGARNLALQVVRCASDAKHWYASKIHLGGMSGVGTDCSYRIVGHKFATRPWKHVMLGALSRITGEQLLRLQACGTRFSFRRKDNEPPKSYGSQTRSWTVALPVVLLVNDGDDLSGISARTEHCLHEEEVQSQCRTRPGSTWCLHLG